MAVESPTYSGALALARFAGVEILPLPMGPDGPDPSAAPRAAGQARLPHARAAEPDRRHDARRAPRRDPRGRDGLPARSSSRTATRSPSRAAARSPRAGRTVSCGSGRCRRTSCRDSASAGSRVRAADHRAPRARQEARPTFRRRCRSRRPSRTSCARGRIARRAQKPRLRGRDAAARGGAGPQERTCRRSPGGAESVGNPLFWLHLPPGVSGRRVAEAAAARGVGVAPGRGFRPERGGPRRTCGSRSRASTSATSTAGSRSSRKRFEPSARSGGVHAAPVV